MPTNPFEPPQEVGTGRPFNWNIVKAFAWVAAILACLALLCGLSLVVWFAFYFDFPTPGHDPPDGSAGY
jgi:hypothetical protein